MQASDALHPARVAEIEAAIDSTVADRFLVAIAQGTVPNFIDHEAVSHDVRMKIGTVINASSSANYASLAIRFLALASYAEARQPLRQHAGVLEEAGRIAAIMTALNGTDQEIRQVREFLLAGQAGHAAANQKLIALLELPSVSA
jgi:hypothetical protein